MAMYGEGQETEVTKLSKINSAGLINLRIHRLFEDANRHCRAGKFLAWNGDLDRVWMELAGDVDPGKKTDKEWKELNEKLDKVGAIKNWKTIDGFSELTEEEKKRQKRQYEKINDKELMLRRLQNKQGKGTAYQDDIETYMDD
ncbi:MAG: hypothetical protein IH845_05815 [Nanoarchaeota archaeon]|nr:hypothetical protein [Nanoarchaeota archaeon]